MEQIEALLILLLFPKFRAENSNELSDEYKKAFDVLTLTEKIDPKIVPIIDIFINSEYSKSSIHNKINLLPNLFCIKPNSPEYKSFVKSILSLKDNFTPNIIKFLQQLLDEKTANRIPPYILSFSLLIILRIHYGIDGDGLPEKDKDTIKKQIKHFLSDSSNESKLIPEKLIPPLQRLRELLHSPTKGATFSTRLEARNICEELHIPLDLPTMLSLCIHGIEQSKDESNEIVLVIGSTGAGKSTLINYLNGVQYKLKTRQDLNKRRLCLEPISGNELANVGHGLKSRTLYPQIVAAHPTLVANKSTFAYCDCPGFLDTRKGENWEEAACASLGVPFVVHKLKKAIRSIIIVIDWKVLETERGTHAFKSEALTLLKLINNNPGFITSGKLDETIPVFFVISKPLEPLRGEYFDVKSSRDTIINIIEDIKSDFKPDVALTNLKEDLNLDELNLERCKIVRDTLLGWERKLQKSHQSKIPDPHFHCIFQNQFPTEPSGNTQGDDVKFELGILSKIWDEANYSEKCKDELESHYRKLRKTAEPDRVGCIVKTRTELKSLEEYYTKQVEERKLEIEKTKGKEFMLDLLLKKRENNLFIIRGHNSEPKEDTPDDRDRLLQSLYNLKLKDLSAIQINPEFDANNEEYNLVRHWAEKMAGDYLELCENFTILKPRIEALIERTKATQVEIDNCHKELEDKISRREPSKESKVEKLNAAILARKNELLELNKKAGKFEVDLGTNKIEKEKISSVKEIEYGSRIRKAQFSFRAMGYKTTWEYSFPGTIKEWGFLGLGWLLNSPTTYTIPISRYEICNKCTLESHKLVTVEQINGQVEEGDDFKELIYSKDLNNTYETARYNIISSPELLDQGILNITFTTKPNTQGFAAVRVFIKPEHLPSNHKTLELIERNFQLIEKQKIEVTKRMESLNERIKNDDNYKHLVSLSLDGDMDSRYNRVRNLLHRLGGWNDKKFIDKFLLSKKEDLTIKESRERTFLWLAQDENLDILEKLSSEQWSMLETESGKNLELAFNMKVANKQRIPIGEDEFKALKQRLPATFSIDVIEAVVNTGFTIKMLIKILQELKKSSEDSNFAVKILKEFQESSTFTQELTDAERNKDNLQFCFNKLFEIYTLQSHQREALWEVLQIMKFKNNSNADKFSELYRDIKERGVIASAYPLSELSEMNARLYIANNFDAFINDTGFTNKNRLKNILSPKAPGKDAVSTKRNFIFTISNTTVPARKSPTLDEEFDFIHPETLHQYKMETQKPLLLEGRRESSLETKKKDSVN